MNRSMEEGEAATVPSKPVSSHMRTVKLVVLVAVLMGAAFVSGWFSRPMVDKFHGNTNNHTLAIPNEESDLQMWGLHIVQHNSTSLDDEPVHVSLRHLVDIPASLRYLVTSVSLRSYDFNTSEYKYQELSVTSVAEYVDGDGMRVVVIGLPNGYVVSRDGMVYFRRFGNQPTFAQLRDALFVQDPDCPTYSMLTNETNASYLSTLVEPFFEQICDGDATCASVAVDKTHQAAFAPWLVNSTRHAGRQLFLCGGLCLAAFFGTLAPTLIMSIPHIVEAFGGKPTLLTVLATGFASPSRKLAGSGRSGWDFAALSADTYGHYSSGESASGSVLPNDPTSLGYLVWRPSNGNWYFKSGDVTATQQWGAPEDVPVPGDYDGDGKPDIAVWRPSNGMWYFKHLGGHEQWGARDDIPVASDYNGDGKTDVAVWRPRNGMWYFKHCCAHQAWGAPSDIPVPSDYDGDGKTDVVVFRPSNGMWYFRDASVHAHVQWGAPGDVPVPADYNGDGKVDIAVWRPSTGVWYFKDPTVHAHEAWGSPSDIPRPLDYDGRGRFQIAVWRPSNGMWYVKGRTQVQWGWRGDIPL